ncbi:MAG: DUF2155 domain-containing protein [Nitrospirota bacterium]
MKRISTILVTGLALSMIMTGCKKKEEQITPTAPMPQSPMVMPQAPMQGPAGAPAPMAPHGNAGPKVEKKIIVPNEVKGKWSKVKLVLEDKTTKKSDEYTVKIGSDFELPNTNLKVKVGEFLPDFRMDGTTLTSGSANPNNPAVRVEVFEGGKSVFKGWLFAKFPTMHPFEHPKYALTLKEGVKS